MHNISLCMICGNEESIILDCLESAKGAFDELCIVRAVGTLSPDGTIENARQWAIRNNKPFQFEEYQNEPDANWPHIDNFASARNLSISLPTNPWWLWLDCDDYLTPINCARIREAVQTAPDNCNAITCRYTVSDDGPQMDRERIIRTGKGRWRGVVHEVCVTPPENLACPQITIYHRNHAHKDQSSGLRNATILHFALRDSPRQHFYYCNEALLANDREAAKIAGHAALEMPIDDTMKYTVFINLSLIEPERRTRYLHAAGALQPWRREAWAYLCQDAIVRGDSARAEAYFRMMAALPLSENMEWTHQGLWHGWGQKLLHIRLLRCCGNKDEADRMECEYNTDPHYVAGVAEWERNEAYERDQNRRRTAGSIGNA